MEAAKEEAGSDLLYIKNTVLKVEEEKSTADVQPSFESGLESES